MALELETAQIGYEQGGVEALKNKIQNNLIGDACDVLTNGANDVSGQIGEFWVGEAADAFENKLKNDTQTLVGKLTELSTKIEGAVYTTAKNLELSDETIAASIRGMSSGASGGSSSNGSSGSATTSSSGSTASEEVSFLGRVGATIGTAGCGFVEGVADFGEFVVDAVAIAGSAYATIYTGIIDTVGAVYSGITGKEYDPITDDMWSATMGFVMTDYVGGWADSFYENTAAGQYLKENSYAFNQVRGVSKVAGNVVAGVVTGSVITNLISTGTSLASGTTALVTNSADDVARIGTGALISSSDDVARIGTTAIANSGDDVARIGTTAIANSGDDVARIGTTAIANSGDDIARIAVNNADDVAKGITNSTDFVIVDVLDTNGNVIETGTAPFISEDIASTVAIGTSSSSTAASVGLGTGVGVGVGVARLASEQNASQIASESGSVATSYAINDESGNGSTSSGISSSSASSSTSAETTPTSSTPSSNTNSQVSSTGASSSSATATSTNQSSTPSETSTSQKSTVDLSNVEYGYSHSGSDNAVHLDTEKGTEAVYDRTIDVNGTSWTHFKQADGETGYAWFKTEDVADLIDDTTSNSN